ncbi:MAG: protein kinase [Chloroflexi bacterium]|nr:protein kinase [Chloroflexota bacterium]
MATEAPRIGGRYVLAETLGRGGMARVYRARDTQLGRDVAVKVMRADLAEDPVFGARFLNEARNAASISHPNVVEVLDYGTDGPGPYLVMELEDGGDLASLIANEGPLSPHRAATIAGEVASAIQAAHKHGIVHRDVKPGNILLGTDGQARVADFGIARATGEQTLTGTGTSLGSVDYFSPEQARGEPATAASDVYALGVVLYEMLTGRRPFSGDTPYAVAVARLEAPPPDPRALRPDIPKPLVTVVERAMTVDPDARYASAATMGRALRTWLARHPAPIVVTAPAPAATGPAAVAAAPAAAPTLAAHRSERRRSPLLLAAAAMLLLAVTGFVGGRLLTATEDPISGVVVGTPRGEVFGSAPDPTARPTPRPTPAPTASPRPQATPAPIAAATPVPAPAAPVTPASTPVLVAMAVSPTETVATWYAHVTNGDLDAAYALWSDRMKANFSREGNLDNRWANTADITFSQLHVVDQTQTTAMVQVEFVETKDDGSSRRFIGWWELVRSRDGWLLDHPHF